VVILNLYNWPEEISAYIKMRINTIPLNSIRLHTAMFLFRWLLAATCVVAASSIILEVPGYGTIKGGQGKTSYTKRPYYSFVGLHYAKKPTNLTRFLVIYLEEKPKN